MTNGNQKIFVWCDFSAEMNHTVEHALMIASILRKEVCLLHCPTKKSQEELEISEAKLRGVISLLVKDSKQEKIHFFVTKDPFRDMLTDFAELYDCILLVAHKKTYPILLPELRHSGFPFLFVSSPKEISNIYKQIVVPVGYMKKSKDLALWASYIGRKYNATIDIFSASESSAIDRKEVQKNIFSIERLYKKFSFPFKIVESHCPTWRLQKSALLHALSFRYGLLVVSVTYQTTFLDILMGLTENKVIRKSENLSVMCINSHRDFYSFCG